MPPAEKVAAVRSLLLKLPKVHYTMLTYFVCLLQAIAKKSNINLMCPMNLGVCVGPSLLWPSTPCEKAPKAVPMVVELLILKAETLFGPQITGLLGSGSPESSNALLDSGAEESDSLHSVGISLDSIELTTPRKEKLSLSRDSGLTLSEDDSNSNGGNSPAPRNILHSLSAPSIQQEGKLVPKYITNENHNVNGLPQISQRQAIYSNKADLYSSVNEDLYTTPYSGERYIHNTINVGFSNVGDDRKYPSKAVVQRTGDIYGQSPAKYITGMEPQKPPRSNVSKAARTSKVYSMYAETAEIDKNITNKSFSRAKSSDNLLEAKQEAMDKKRDIVSSQENILYSNLHDLAMFTENLQRQYPNGDVVPNTNYSRVYTRWEEKSANYNSSTTSNSASEPGYGHNTNREQGESSQNKFNGSITPAATIFTRNDWSRQAARTKSLEVNEDGQTNNNDRMRNGNYEVTSLNTCRKRRFDPAHMCTNSCNQSPTVNKREPLDKPMNPLQTSYSYVENIQNLNPEESKKSRLRTFNNNRLNQSKSLANIILQSDSSSSDTLYQPQNSFTSRSTESPASETSFENCYTTQYIEPLYTSVYNRRRDIFHEGKKANIFPTDIYKATPTAVQPEYQGPKEQNITKKPPHMPPPVPPRKMIYQRVLKKFPPVHAIKEDKASRSKSVPPVYREPPNGTDQNKNGQNVLALDASESDTESESYV